MKDKIKEILDRLDYNEWEVDLYKVPITWCELYDIRDYITNLQDRIDKAIEMFDNKNLNKYYYGMSYEFEINDFKKDLLNILQGKSDE